MSTPTAINEEYDIVIAGGEPYSILPTCLPSADRVVVRLRQAEQRRASLLVVSLPPTRTYASSYSRRVPLRTTIPRTPTP